MAALTLVMYWATVAIVLLVAPFTIFYYEGASDNDESDDKK
jgi:hypothetical protein